MTPFGEKLRALRAERGIAQNQLAAALQISPAYLSALEHGKRGIPSAGLLHQICAYFGLIWDDADALQALAKLSRPRLKLSTAGLTPAQTELANRFVRALRNLDPETVETLNQLLAPPEILEKKPPARVKTRAKVTAAAPES
jgi:transcriptional regulator with XRE-family HTH domain